MYWEEAAFLTEDICINYRPMSFESEWLFNATSTVEIISWRGRPDNLVAVGFDPKNSSSTGGALEHTTTRPRPTTGPPRINYYVNTNMIIIRLICTVCLHVCPFVALNA